MEKIEEHNKFPPSQIIIDGYIFIFKDEYKKGLC